MNLYQFLFLLAFLLVGLVLLYFADKKDSSILAILGAILVCVPLVSFIKGFGHIILGFYLYLGNL